MQLIANEVGDLRILDDEIIKHATVVGDVEASDVWKYSAAEQELYFFAKDTHITAYVIISSRPDGQYRLLHGIKNISGRKGLVLALVMFLTRRLGLRLKIAANEKLSSGGMTWAKSLIAANGQGLTLTGRNGKPVDAQTLEKEWETCRDDRTKDFGSTFVIIESKGLPPLKTKDEYGLLPLIKYFSRDID